LLLGATDRAIRLVDRFATCFQDSKRQDLIEHEAATLTKSSGPLKPKKKNIVGGNACFT
jgi:hypothetical protein